MAWLTFLEPALHPMTPPEYDLYALASMATVIGDLKMRAIIGASEPVLDQNPTGRVTDNSSLYAHGGDRPV